ncbi:MBL fold metallo-hydrolase [Candidatus Uhrbacteria bacterium]|nr:MBL fold metallo-hydrolase [Candidatus Uhrbacteria bacterium]
MTFEYIGGDVLLISSKRKDTGEVFVATDPVGPFSGGLRSRKADVAIGSFHQPQSDLLDVIKPAATDGTVLAITTPGEFERNTFFVTGVEAANGNTMYRFDGEEIAIAYLAGATEALTQHQLDMFEGVHVVILPAAGPVSGKGLAIDVAAEIVRALEPAVVIGIRTHSALHPSLKGAEMLAKALELPVNVQEGSYRLTRANVVQGDGAAMQLIGFATR